MGYDSRPTYQDAIRSAARPIAEAKRICEVHDYAVLLIAGILAGMYGLETRAVMLDLKGTMKRGGKQ